MDKPLSETTTYRDRVLLALFRHKRLEPFALRALMKATHFLGLTLGSRLAEMHESGDLRQKLLAEAHVQGLHAHLFHEAAHILGSRFDKLLERQRPHYSPEARFRILRLKTLLALSSEETARLFRISQATVSRWQQEVATAPEREAVGRLLKPVPPVRRYADCVRHLVQTMALAGFPGSLSIAQTLARAGWKISKRTIARIRREKLPPPPTETTPSRALVARYPNHIWMADLTEIPSLFRLFSFKLGVVFDAFSRMPLASRLFPSEPSAGDMRALLDEAARWFGLPRHFVSDQGSQFTATRFRDRLRAWGIRHRFGAIGKTGSIALLERLWKSLKQGLGLPLVRPAALAVLGRRIDLELLYYAHLRPHQGLGGATPAEVHFGRMPAHLSAVPPPRARPGEGPAQSPFVIDHLDREQRLPLLLTKAA